jgi:hypothetical protein
MAAVRTPAPEPSRVRALLSARDSAPVRWRSRLSAGLAGAAVAVTALATLVAVSAGAGPGDALYGLKRGTEQTQLALAGDSTRGQTLLDFASTRLAELRTLVGEDTTAAPVAGGAADGDTVLAAGASPELVLQTMRTMDAQTTEGAASLDDRAVTTGSAAPLDLLAHWALRQSTGLQKLRADLPAEADTALIDSLGLLSDIGSRVSGLRTALDCAAGPATRGSDALGPVPTPCGVPSLSNGGSGGGTGAPPVAGVPGTTATPGSSGTTAGSGTGAAPSGGSGSSGSSGVQVPVPSGQVPTPPTAGLPTVPLPSLPAPTGKVTLPSVTLPGTSIGTPPSTGSSSLGVCIGPISLGNC